MVDNQHKKITGYRDLSEAEIALMNEIKAHEKQTAELLSRVFAVARATSDGPNEGTRQAAIAKTEFEHAFMRLVRAVARPASPWEV